MGYACPVCEIPQRDGEHLAHHLAFTAMLHGDDHEAWLDERADDWRGMEPDELSAIVVADADDAEYHEVFEDTTDRTGGHDHDHGTPFERGVDAAAARGRGGGRSDETRAVIEEARELTQEMLADDGDGDAGSDEADGDTSGAGEAGDADGAGTGDDTDGTDDA